MRNTRAGALLSTRLTTRRESDGAPVSTSTTESIYRGVKATGDEWLSRVIESLPESQPELSLRLPIPIARELPHVYSETARIWNPIHTERAVAARAGLPDIILHGTATWALAGREIVRRFAGGHPQHLLRLTGQFTGMVIPGTEITLQLSEPDANGWVGYQIRNHEQEIAIRRGWAQLST